MVATVAWLFTNAIDQILKTPYLVYEVSNEQNKQDNSLIDTTITLDNITDDKSYTEVELRTITRDPDIILNGTVQPYLPAWEGDEPPSVTPHSFTHVFPKIQPRGRFYIYVTHKTRGSMGVVLVAYRRKV